MKAWDKYGNPNSPNKFTANDLKEKNEDEEEKVRERIRHAEVMNDLEIKQLTNLLKGLK